MIVSRSVITQCLGVSSQRLTQLIQDHVLPRAKAHGQYHLETTVHAYLKHVRQRAMGELAAEQARWTKAKADRAELDLRQRAGELCEVAKIKQAMFERGRQVRDAVLSVADRIAGLCAAESDQSKVHQLIHRELHQALETLTKESHG
jgi:phage terminase Nu1 subunit (DNA packaging protein)